MDPESKTPPDIGEDIRRLKRDVLFLRILHIVQCVIIIGLFIRYSRIIETISLLSERLDLLDKSVGQSWDGYSILFDILKELTEQLQFSLS